MINDGKDGGNNAVLMDTFDVVSTKLIRVGDEILFSYGSSYWDISDDGTDGTQ